MENIDHLDSLAPQSVENAVWVFDQLSNARPLISVNNTTELGKCSQLVASLQNGVYRTVRGFGGFSRNITVNVGERS